MVMKIHIEDVDGPQKHILITDRWSGSRIKPLRLNVHEPGIGEFAPVTPGLADIHHIVSWSSAVTREVITSSTSFSRKVNLLSSTTHDVNVESTEFFLPFSTKNTDKSSWVVHPSNFGEVSYTTNYWEWTEYILAKHRRTLTEAHVYGAVYTSLFTYDRCENVMRAFCNKWCPSTNTLHTPIGELSISICDLYSLAGLRATGGLYDEVVPSAKELFPRSAPNPIMISCKFLLLAFFKLADGDPNNVTFERWIQFWFTCSRKYDAPSRRLIKKKSTAHPKTTHNPSPPGDRPISSSSSMESNRSIEDLQILEAHRATVHLAAFLSCWICKFLLPSKIGDCIRPGVFKIASFIAKGNSCSLAVPVLCSIYKGLSEITYSPTLTECRASFPIHFVYAWIARHFDSHFQHPSPNFPTAMVQFHGERMAKYFSRSEAAKLFEGLDLNFHTFLPVNDDERVLVDDGKLISPDFSFFVSIRSCYLTLRQGKSYVITHYSPHRFARQFGFCQDVPGSLKMRPHCNSVKELKSLWKSSVRHGSQSKVTMSASSVMPLCTKEYGQWRDSLTYKGKVTILNTGSTSREEPSPQVMEPTTCLPPSTPHSQAVDVSSTNVDSPNPTSSESATVSDDCDRPWNRPSKKRRSTPALPVPVDDLADIPPMEGFPESPRSFMNHLQRIENAPFVEDLIDNTLANVGDDDFVDCMTTSPQLESHPPQQDHLVLEAPPASSCGGTKVKNTEFEAIESIRQGVLGQLTHISIENVSILEKNVNLLMEDMHHAGISDFKASLVALFDSVRAYNSAKLEHDSSSTDEAYQERLSAAQEKLEKRKSRLIDAEAGITNTKSEVATLKSRIDALLKRQEEFKEESQSLRDLIYVDEKVVVFAQNFPRQSITSEKKVEHTKGEFEAKYQAVMNWKPR